jgi:integrase
LTLAALRADRRGNTSDADEGAAVDLLDWGKLILIVAAPTLIGAVVISAPRVFAAIARAWPERRAREPQPAGPPIQQLAVDLRRLLRLHADLTANSYLGIRAQRLWAIERAIGVRAVEAARALDVPHREPEPPAALSHDELSALLYALGEAGMVLPAKVGPFTGDGRL